MQPIGCGYGLFASLCEFVSLRFFSRPDLKGVSLDVAVNAIIGAMLQAGYLDEARNSILVSVESGDAARGAALEQEVSAAIAAATQTDSLSAAVLSQTISATDETLTSLAAEYDISLGKAALIQEVVAQDATLTVADLAGVDINEIALLISSNNISTSTTQTGTASDRRISASPPRSMRHWPTQASAMPTCCVPPQSWDVKTA